MSQIIFDGQPRIYAEKETCKILMPDMHYHNTHELYYILEGGREYFIEDKFFTAHKGDFVFVPSGMLHRTDGQLTTRILTYVDDSFTERFFTRHTLDSLLPREPLVFRPEENLSGEFETIVRKLFDAYITYKENSCDTNEYALSGLLYKLLFFISSERNTYVEEPLSDKRISSIIQYINSNFSQITSIEEIADHFFLSKYYLCHLFKASLGVPLITYLHTIRIKAACEMICSGNHTITEIATKCGFNTTPYFCKVFKDEKGITPSEYRRTVQKKL